MAQPNLFGLRPIESLRSRVLGIFRSARNVAYLRGVIGQSFRDSPGRRCALTGLLDNVRKFELHFGHVVFDSDPMLQRLNGDSGLEAYNEVRRLNMEFIRQQRHIIEESNDVITKSARLPVGSLVDGGDDYPLLAFYSQSVAHGVGLNNDRAYDPLSLQVQVDDVLPVREPACGPGGRAFLDGFPIDMGRREAAAYLDDYTHVNARVPGTDIPGPGDGGSALSDPRVRRVAELNGSGREGMTAAPANYAGREGMTAAPANYAAREGMTAAPANYAAREGMTAAPANYAGMTGDLMERGSAPPATGDPAGEDFGEQNDDDGTREFEEFSSFAAQTFACPIDGMPETTKRRGMGADAARRSRVPASTRSQRYPSIPFWQVLNMREHDRDIRDSLGTKSLELGNVTRRFDMRALRTPGVYSDGSHTKQRVGPRVYGDV